MKDAMTYAHEAGFFSFNVVGWKSEFERLIASIRAEYEAPLKQAEEVAEHARNICLGMNWSIELPDEALAAIREALVEPTVKESLTVADHIADGGKMVSDMPAADLLSIAGRLALELECLLMDTKDLSVVSKWWDSAHDALEQWQTNKGALYAAPVQPVQEPCKECGAKQAQIDRLMLEYCPDEMTDEQLADWGRNQKPFKEELNWGASKFMPHEQPVKLSNSDNPPNKDIKQEPVPPAFLRRPGSFSHE